MKKRTGVGWALAVAMLCGCAGENPPAPSEPPGGPTNTAAPSGPEGTAGSAGIAPEKLPGAPVGGKTVQSTITNG